MLDFFPIYSKLTQSPIMAQFETSIEEIAQRVQNLESFLLCQSGSASITPQANSPQYSLVSLRDRLLELQSQWAALKTDTMKQYLHKCILFSITCV